MKPGRFTEEQIIGILREHDAATSKGDVARKYGVSRPTHSARIRSRQFGFVTVLRLEGLGL